MQKILKLLGMAILSLALLACGGDDDDSDSEDTTTTTAPPVDDTDDTDDSDDVDDSDDTDDTDGPDDEAPTDDEATAEVTAPGTELAIGDSAVVPYGDSMEGLIEITVTEIVAGDKAAFDAAFGEDAQSLDPFYIRYSVELLSIAPDDSPDVPALRGTAPDGGPTGTVIVGSLDGCESERFESDAVVGDTVETCRLQAAATGETVGGAEYDEHDDYSDDEVLWLV